MLIAIGTSPGGREICSGHQLHALLAVTTRFDIWINRMIELGFSENVDFQRVYKTVQTFAGAERQALDDVVVTVDMAKHIAMVQRSPQGHQVRQFFIDRDLQLRRVEQPRTLPSYQIEDPIQRAEQWIREQKEKQALAFENAELKPKAEYADAVLLSTSEVTTTKIAQELGMTAQRLNKVLHQHGVQYKQSGIWNLTRAYNGKGYAKLSTFAHTGKDGRPRTEHYLVWTETGRHFIHSLLNPALSANQPTANNQLVIATA